MRRAQTFVLALAVALAAALPAGAHLGSPDVFHDGLAGPYRLLVTIRPPQVVPGVAEIEIRSGEADLSALRILPMPMHGDGAKFAPTPDTAVRSKDDPRLFTGSLWLMRAGSWEVRVLADGARGKGELAVPVPALPERTLGMERALAAGLLGLLLVLSVGMVSIAGAAAREGSLEPGLAPGAPERRRARRVMAVAALVVGGALYGGNAWWAASAEEYAEYVYKPIAGAATLEPGERLALRLSDPGWLRSRKVDDLVPDHGHLVHLFMLRVPEMDEIRHLHPERRAPGEFTHALPPTPAGRWRLFADVVHATGLGETAVAEIDLPAIAGAPLSGDDSAGAAPGSKLLVMDPPGRPLRAKETVALRFRALDGAGRPARDMELYMGMLGHLAVVRRDGGVFAHIHPSGSVPMAALEIAAKSSGDAAAAPLCHDPGAAALPSEVAFPYGFPSAGEYRLFLQMKRAGRVETGVFDVHVDE